MRSRIVPAAFLLALVAAPSSSCTTARKIAEGVEELFVDGWAPMLGVALGSLGGPIATIVGGSLGGAYAVARQRLHAAEELTERYRRGEVYGRQQAKELSDASRGAPIQLRPSPEP